MALNGLFLVLFVGAVGAVAPGGLIELAARRPVVTAVFAVVSVGMVLYGDLGGDAGPGVH
jgi:hypothetical protein